MNAAVGLDVGSTWMKAIAIGPDDEHLATARLPTPWHTVADGGTQTTADELETTVHRLLVDLDERLGGRTVGSIGVTGMAEAGVLMDAAGRVVTPVPAWFDPRGGAEFDAQPARLRDAFPGVTGLPVSSLATLAKLLHHRAHGVEPAGLTWLDVPEYVVHRLGGEIAGETSLVARTGLIDQDTGEPWEPALAAVGADAALLPPRRTAGSVWGLARGVPASMSGAVLTVAGHDHLVASVASGVVGTHQLYDSMGTAEALVRVLDRPLAPARRAALAAANINTVRHLLPGRFTLLAGTRAGLVLRRTLTLVGVRDDAGRDALDAQVTALLDAGTASGTDAGCDGIRVTGAVNTESSLGIRVDTDDVSPALLFAAALRHGTDVLREVVDRLDAEVGPATQTVIAGGWTRMASVRSARVEALPGVTFSTLAEDTAHGAARIGRFAADTTATDLAGYLAGPTRPPSAQTSAQTGNPRRTMTDTHASSLDDIALADGTFAVVAMDQRNTLKRMYAAVGVSDPAVQDLVDIKADVVEALAGSASAFLLDPTYGIPALDQVDPVVRKGVGILVAAEPADRQKYGDEPRGTRDAGLDAAWVRAQGGDALKFLIQVRADRPLGDGPDLAAESVEVIRQVVEDCRSAGVPSVIENLIYPLPGEDLSPEARADAIIAAAVALDRLGPDLLKLEYPGSPEACRRLADSISAPWAVLSAGVGFDEFSEVLRISCDEGGASGFIAGRAVWKETVGMPREQRRAYLADEGRRRLDACVAAIDGRAVPWRRAGAGQRVTA